MSPGDSDAYRCPELVDHLEILFADGPPPAAEIERFCFLLDRDVAPQNTKFATPD